MRHERKIYLTKLFAWMYRYNWIAVTSPSIHTNYLLVIVLALFTAANCSALQWYLSKKSKTPEFLGFKKLGEGHVRKIGILKICGIKSFRFIWGNLVFKRNVQTQLCTKGNLVFILDDPVLLYSSMFQIIPCQSLHLKHTLKEWIYIPTKKE